MSAMETMQKTSDKRMLHAAFKAMRKNGVKAILGVPGCCRTCIWHQMSEEWADKPVVWFYNGQGNKLAYDLDDNVTSHSVIYLNHNSSEFPTEIAECVRILKDEGLSVEWSGDQTSCITVRFG